MTATPAFTRPNVEERLASAAFTILTDDHHHSRDAKIWALSFLDRSSMGRGTAFLRSHPQPIAHARAFLGGH